MNQSFINSNNQPFQQFSSLAKMDSYSVLPTMNSINGGKMSEARDFGLQSKVKASHPEDPILIPAYTNKAVFKLLIGHHKEQSQETLTQLHFGPLRNNQKVIQDYFIVKLFPRFDNGKYFWLFPASDKMEKSMMNCLGWQQEKNKLSLKGISKKVRQEFVVEYLRSSKDHELRSIAVLLDYLLKLVLPLQKNKASNQAEKWMLTTQARLPPIMLKMVSRLCLTF